MYLDLDTWYISMRAFQQSLTRDNTIPLGHIILFYFVLAAGYFLTNIYKEQYLESFAGTSGPRVRDAGCPEMHWAIPHHEESP